jgi:ABC-type transport system involved in cytochrome bd biosynthesis fused ATPase/permease subunit
VSSAPGLFADGRGRRFAQVAALGLGEAAAMALAAFATRALFARWHEGLAPHGALAALTAAAFLLAACRWGGRVAAEALGQDHAASVRRAVFAQLGRMPARAAAARRGGALALRFTGDLAALSGWASRGAARLVSAGVALPPTAAALVWLSPAAALGAAGPLLAGIVAMALAGRPLGRLHRRLRRARARLAADMAERLPLAPALRRMGRGAAERRKLDARTARLARAAAARRRASAALRALPGLAGGVAAAGAALACWRAGAPAAELAGALAALALMVAPLRDLAGVWDCRRAERAARARLAALLAAPRLKRAGAAPPLPGRAALRFDDLTAGPLRGFSGRLRGGETALLAGPNGSGKSLLLEIAAGLAAPEAGAARVFGLAPAAAREAAFHQSARPVILAGSLRRALALGVSPRPGDAALEAVSRRFGLGPALERLGGLNGRVAEGGRNLSDGEAARIGLVRLALSPDRLALLDEPDAALDAEGRALLATLLAERPGPALCALRHEPPPGLFDRVWTLGGHASGAAAA